MGLLPSSSKIRSLEGPLSLHVRAGDRTTAGAGGSERLAAGNLVERVFPLGAQGSHGSSTCGPAKHGRGWWTKCRRTAPAQRDFCHRPREATRSKAPLSLRRQPIRLTPCARRRCAKKKALGEGLGDLVARTRFELVISALRGRRPKPLDERAIQLLAGRGWDGGNRTPTDGTRIRCPTVRRHPKGIVLRVCDARKNST